MPSGTISRYGDLTFHGTLYYVGVAGRGVDPNEIVPLAVILDMVGTKSLHKFVLDGTSVEWDIPGGSFVLGSTELYVDGQRMIRKTAQTEADGSWEYEEKAAGEGIILASGIASLADAICQLYYVPAV